MSKKTLEQYLLLKGKAHISLMEFWAALMNETKGQIADWLEKAGYKQLKELEQYLRPNQIRTIELTT